MPKRLTGRSLFDAGATEADPWLDVHGDADPVFYTAVVAHQEVRAERRPYDADPESDVRNPRVGRQRALTSPELGQVFFVVPHSPSSDDFVPRASRPNTVPAASCPRRRR